MREVKAREKAVVDTLRLTSEICTQRHHEGLFRKMKENLPEFFGFESVGVLIYNFESNWLFTDPDQHKEGRHHKDEDSDAEEKHLKPHQARTPGHKTPGATSPSKGLKPDPETEAQREKQVHQKKFMQFPCNSGISGQVFHSGQIFISNNAAKETKFQDEIDNQSATTEVKNFLIGPVYGERKDVPNGIIQFINKRGGGNITPQDE